MATVSVPIATYNRAGFLKECLDSVFAQTYTDLQVIVVDDGSTDNTAEVLASYGDRIKYVLQDHRGNIATYHHARSLCTGKYMTYFGDDDVLLPNFIERGVAVLEGDPNIVKYCTNCFTIDYAGKRIGNGTYLQSYRRPSGKVTLDDLLLHGCFVHGGIDRRSVFEEVGYFDPSFPHAGDYDLYLRITGAGYSIYYINEPLFNYRIHQGMRSRRESEMWMETIAVLEANLERFPDAYRRLDRQMQRKLGMNKAWLSVRLFWEKDFARSIKYALAATRQYPPAVPIGAMQMAYSNLKGKRSVYLSAD